MTSTCRLSRLMPAGYRWDDGLQLQKGLRVDGKDVGDVLIAENLAHPYVCGKYSCPRRQSWCPLVPNALLELGLSAPKGSDSR
jgi:hypothetical protein